MRTELPALPEPTDAERAHAARVADHLAARIDDAGGQLPFDRFMDLALHAPGLGYYACGVRLGAAGDFTTAPEMGEVFGRCLARGCAEVLGWGGGDLLEFGAGSGALCVTLLRALDALDALPRRYLVLETSEAMRAAQQRAVATLPPSLAGRVTWLSAMPTGFRGVVVANEVLDAMPVTRFAVTDDGIDVLAVRGDRHGFAWCPADRPPSPSLEALVRRHALPPGYCSEYRPRAAAFVHSLAEHLDQAVAFLVDYGYPAATYYHPQRHRGTLQCYFRHAVHDDPLVLTGIQDITAHVDFSALAVAAGEAGLDVVGYATQAGFLVGAGLAGVATALAGADAASQLALANQVKRLTLPTEMGEVVKVLALSRGFTRAPSVFDGHDRSGQLAAQAA